MVNPLEMDLSNRSNIGEHECFTEFMAHRRSDWIEELDEKSVRVLNYALEARKNPFGMEVNDAAGLIGKEERGASELRTKIMNGEVESALTEIEVIGHFRRQENTAIEMNYTNDEIRKEPDLLIETPAGQTVAEISDPEPVHRKEARDQNVEEGKPFEITGGPGNKMGLVVSNKLPQLEPFSDQYNTMLILHLHSFDLVTLSEHLLGQTEAQIIFDEESGEIVDTYETRNIPTLTLDEKAHHLDMLYGYADTESLFYTGVAQPDLEFSADLETLTDIATILDKDEEEYIKFINNEHLDFEEFQERSDA